MEQIATATELAGKANVIAPGDTVEGNLAGAASAEYRFEGVANSPVLFTASGADGLRYHVQVFNGKKSLDRKSVV